MNFGHIKQLTILLLSIFICFMGLHAQEADGSEHLSKCVENAWKTSWEKFYKSETHLFYDYLTSYAKGQELAHLPVLAEVQQQIPNNCGYGTGQEDCMISAGVLISMIVDRYAVTQDESLRERAYNVFKGIQLCTLGHGVTGFVARAVCHEDLKSIYISSSRDQYTHAVYGLWNYFRSPLPDAGTKQEIGVIVSAIADRMITNVIAANNYDSLRADGTYDTRGISRMWNVQGHEAARLPMIYAAAWDVTGNQKYYEQYRLYIESAIDQSLLFESSGQQPTYALLQMQASLDLLRQLETDQLLKEKIEEAMALVSLRCEERARSSAERSKLLDLKMLAADWREAGGGLDNSTYRTVWYCIRESGEAISAILMDYNHVFTTEQEKLLTQCVEQLDYDQVSSCGIFDLQSAYWKARRSGVSFFEYTQVNFSPVLDRQWSTICTNQVLLEWDWPENAASAQLNIDGMNSEVVVDFEEEHLSYMWQVFSGGIPANEDLYDLSLLFFNNSSNIIHSLNSRLALTKGAFGAAVIDFGPDDTKWSKLPGNVVLAYDAKWGMTADVQSVSQLVISKRGGSLCSNLLSNASGMYGWKVVNSNWGYGVFDLSLNVQGVEEQWNANLVRMMNGSCIEIR